MYYLVLGNGDEYLTENDTTAEMARMEGCHVMTDLEPEEINQHLEYHERWQDMKVK
jgi:hypothetical protein